jgi:hypothetical protein
MERAWVPVLLVRGTLAAADRAGDVHQDSAAS